MSIINSLSQPPAFASFAELAGSIVCLPLKTFAAADLKPTKCIVATAASRRQGTKRKAARALRAALPAPCYLGANRAAAAVPASYWTAYASYAQAIETLAHEAAHMSGILPDDVAECTGMQWIQTVAVALGDTPDDGEAIAKYFWDEIYASKKLAAPAYWSADCRPGGPLDVRPPGKTAWP